MDEKTPHLHLTFVPLTKDNRLCAKAVSYTHLDVYKRQVLYHADELLALHDKDAHAVVARSLDGGVDEHFQNPSVRRKGVNGRIGARCV